MNIESAYSKHVSINVQQMSAPSHLDDCSIQRDKTSLHGSSSTAVTTITIIIITAEHPLVNKTQSSNTTLDQRCRPESASSTQQSLPLLHQLSVARHSETSRFYQAECILSTSRPSGDKSISIAPRRGSTKDGLDASSTCPIRMSRLWYTRVLQRAALCQ